MQKKAKKGNPKMANITKTQVKKRAQELIEKLQEIEEQVGYINDIENNLEELIY